MWIDPLGLAAEGPFAGFKRAALMVGGYAWQATRTATHDPLMAPWLGPFGWTAWFVVPAPDDSFISDATLGERMNPLNQIYAGFTAAANEPDPFKAGAHTFNGARGTGAIIELLAGVPCRWPTTPQEAPYPWQTKQVAHYHLLTTPQKVHYPSRMTGQGGHFRSPMMLRGGRAK